MKAWDKPTSINRSLPDIVACKTEPTPERIIIEVETFQKLDDPKTKRQIDAFSKAVREDATTKFMLIVI